MEGSIDTFGETVYDHLGQYFLQYCIIVSDDPVPQHKEYSRVFSLAVIKTGVNEETESYFAYDVARSYDSAKRIMCVMRNNTVTPCTVKDVLDDVL